MTEPSFVPLGPEQVVLDSALAQALNAARVFGATHGFLAPHLCGCGNPTCWNDRPETLSFAGILRAVATEWTHVSDPAGESRLRQGLLALGRAFNLFACPCGDPGCPTTKAEITDTRLLLRTIADVWHGRAGNRVAPTTASLAEKAERLALNLAMLEELAGRMPPGSDERFRAVADRAVRDESRAWPTEARAMAAEAIATWVDAPNDRVEVRRVLDSALAIGYHAGWTVADTADLQLAAANACSAILTLGTVHESVSEVLYAPFNTIITLPDLAATVDAFLLADAAA